MMSESERIEEVRKYIETTIAEIDGHTEKMEELFKMDKTSKDKELYEMWSLYAKRQVRNGYD